jgi:hypothetical protein
MRRYIDFGTLRVPLKYVVFAPSTHFLVTLRSQSRAIHQDPTETIIYLGATPLVCNLCKIMPLLRQLFAFRSGLRSMVLVP